MNKIGQIVQWEWENLPNRFRYVDLGAYVVMPNHFHGILNFNEHGGESRQNQIGKSLSQLSSPLEPQDGAEGSSLSTSPRPYGTGPASLGAIISQFKSRVTKRLWKIPALKGTTIWQRNYYEHIIRNEPDLENKTNYINANPLVWAQDDENPG